MNNRKESKMNFSSLIISESHLWDSPGRRLPCHRLPPAWPRRERSSSQRCPCTSCRRCTPCCSRRPAPWWLPTGFRSPRHSRSAATLPPSPRCLPRSLQETTHGLALDTTAATTLKLLLGPDTSANTIAPLFVPESILPGT